MTDNGLIHRGYVRAMEEMDELALAEGILAMFEKPFFRKDGTLKYIVRVRKLRGIGPDVILYEYVVFWRLSSDEHKLFSMSFCSDWLVQEVEAFAEQFLQKVPGVTCPEVLVPDEK